MKILVVGQGGREHAIAWQAAQSHKINQVFVAPGNAGTALENKCHNIDIAATDIDALIAFAKTEAVDLTIVGPEQPLALGIVDQFQQAGLACFGPTQAAAQLESSKSYSKDFMSRHSIPTANYASFTEIDAAKTYVQQHGTPIVIKASGLAAGKGVVIAQSEMEAVHTIEDMLAGKRFGEAGHEIVIEEFLTGEEASFIVIADGEQALALASSQDHKARDNGDRGPNTGGMGAYSPAPVITDELHQRIMQDIIQPTLTGMKKDGYRFTGFLYAGLMITANRDIKVLEFNCRCGDPETQPLMLRLKTNIVDLCLAALNHNLTTIEVEWDPRPALGVVLAAGGYPDSYVKGAAITGLEKLESTNCKTFHAGTKQDNDRIVTNGGRVVCVTALGDDIAKAQTQAYLEVAKIDWDGMFCRTDIGYRAIELLS